MTKSHFIRSKISHWLVAAALFAPAVQAETIQPSGCHVDGVREQVLCATVPVAENPGKPEGRKIDMNVVILPSFSSAKEQPPLLILAGGPGQAATEQAVMVERMFRQVRAHRDIVMIDQRGTGKSNPLACDNFEDEAFAALDFNNATMDLAEQGRICLKGLTESDLSQYSSEQAVDDFEAVREALGYSKYHLYGVSYGTRAGLIYMRRHPDSLESVVLDGVAPTQQAIGAFGQTSEQAFELLLSGCRDSNDCQAAFPELKQDFQRLVAKLRNDPPLVKIHHPVTGEQDTLLVDHIKFLNAVRNGMYMTDTRRMLPLVIHEASKDNFRPFSGFYGMMGSGGGTGMYMGMTLTVLCSEDWSRVTAKAKQLDDNNYVVGNMTSRLWDEFCSVWPTYPVDPGFAEPVKSELPVLLLSGRLDPVTPPSWADNAAQTLSNSRHLVAVNGSHAVATHTCAPRVIASFLNGKALSELDDSCLTKPRKPRFLINFGTTSL